MRQDPHTEYRFEAIGTAWTLSLSGSLGALAAADVRHRIDEFDAIYSRFRDDSLVSRIARRPGRFEFPDDAVELFDLYHRLYRATSGAMSPLIGNSLVNLGYDAGYSLVQRGAPIPAPSWDEGFRWEGLTVTVPSPVLIDVGAAGKGYLVDLVAGVLSLHGHEGFTVDAGGDITRCGEPVLVALEDPRDPAKAIGTVAVGASGSRAICASAGNRRRWGRGLHHILDARTGSPAGGMTATWVVADSALLADALCTALFFADAGELSREFDFSCVMMRDDGTVLRSANFEGEIFT